MEIPKMLKVENDNKIHKWSLPQIKLFPITDYRDEYGLEKDVNNFVVESFNKTGNTPNIEVSLNHIAVINNHNLKVNR